MVELRSTDSPEPAPHKHLCVPLPDHLLSLTVVRMIWWFLILGCSTLVVVCVAIALYMRLRRHLQAAHAAREGSSSEMAGKQPPGDIER
jgi:hypothetical protein